MVCRVAPPCRINALSASLVARGDTFVSLGMRGGLCKESNSLTARIVAWCESMRVALASDSGSLGFSRGGVGAWASVSGGLLGC